MKIHFVGIDDWSRAIFKCKRGLYYCCLDFLFHPKTSEEEVLNQIDSKDIVYYGRSLDDDPDGSSCAVEIVRNSEW